MLVFFACFHIDMERQIHVLEQEAYSAVLRAFKAQSDAISWDKEEMITNLRRELRVSDGEHRELLNNVDNNDVIKRIRDWRERGGNQASWKRQKTFQSNPGEAVIGRKVRTKWPEDDNFYEAVITRYDAAKGLHELVYDLNTPNKTSWEWIDLNEISPKDIIWDEEENGATLNGGGAIHGNRRTLGNGGRGRGPRTQPMREHLAMQNGSGRKFSDEIELFNTDSLVKEVERVFGSNLPNPLELDKAKKLLKEHEQALIAAIARLADASDYESDGEEPYLLQG